MKTGICRIKDFDWLSGNALESSGVMGGKTRGEKTDGEKQTSRKDNELR